MTTFIKEDKWLNEFEKMYYKIAELEARINGYEEKLKVNHEQLWKEFETIVGRLMFQLLERGLLR